ncbi:NAD(P)/FAD-dependent oxidoreductase [Paratractidigestivibacter sp.]|uniref:NAD(P)/FAD-dependent oxidoreductase n=1 Tax=Paratractidigestivibacter sp. TaxID=2847316 RepID=UPI002ABE7AE0|nr:NAD(P)/FAD-dependent oxidoreductase [Paratractidigestivibacter sp.]
MAKKVSRAKQREALAAAAAAVQVPERCDVVVVGGGAAGLVAAVCAAEAGASVVVFERELECGRKILATGNGRCNFAHENLDAARCNNPQFVQGVCGLADAWLADVLAFWRGCGMAWVSDSGRLYPMSLQAASVRNLLLARARRAGVVLACGREAASLGELPRAAATVIACGGGAELVGGFGLEARPFSPVLCPVAARPVDAGFDLAAVDGRRARAHAALLRGGREVFAEDGEVLFRSWGLSGIVMFDFSRRVEAGDVIRLDLTCGMGAEKLAGLVPEGVLDPQVARALGKDALARATALDFRVEGLAETNKAQVKRGGLLASQFDPATLGACERPGLFACGEALDVDADCGGFNLAWAWKSGIVAGSAAAEYALLARKDKN